MKRSLLIPLILLSACGPQPITQQSFYPPQRNTASIDPAAQPQYDTFVAQASINGITLDPFRLHNIVIQFTNINEASAIGQGFVVIGLCYSGIRNPDGTYSYVVKLDQGFWDTADQYAQEVLVLHELGHCLLNRKHRPDLDAFGTPVSLMNPVILSDWSSRQDSYLSELYTHIDDMDDVSSSLEKSIDLN